MASCDEASHGPLRDRQDPNQAAGEKHTAVGGLRDVEATIWTFANEQDANSPSQAIGKCRAMMQHEREPVRDFATRFQDVIDELHDFNCNTGDDQARFEEFKLKTKESAHVAEKGHTTMEAAVQATSLREQEQDRKFTSPKVPGMGNINAIKLQRDWCKDREGNRRCGHCSRKGKHTAEDCRDRKEGRPRMTIGQLNEHCEKLKSERKAEDKDWQHAEVLREPKPASTVRRLGPLDQVAEKERKFAQADGNSSMRTVGELMPKPQTPGSDAETQIKTRVAMTLSMELLLGQDTLEKLGGIVSFCNHKVHCAKSPKRSGRTISQNVMRLDQWTSESSVNALEFMDASGQ
eukprot:jgi/Bigna1/137108/aug1.37_g11816